MRNIIISLFFLSVIGTSLAQNDSIKVEELYELGVKEKYINFKNSKAHFEKAIKLIDSIVVEKSDSNYFLLKKALILDRLSYYHRKEKNYALGLITIQESLKIKKAIKETYTLCETYHIFGRLYAKKKDSVKAMIYYNKSKKAAEKYNNKEGVVDVLNALAGYYLTFDNLEKAHEYCLQALNYADSINYVRGKALALLYQSGYERRKKRYVNVIVLSKEDLKLSKSINNNPGIERSYKALGYAYRKLKQPKLAVDYYQKSLNLVKTIGTTGLLANRYLSLSNAHTDLKEHVIAFKYYRLCKRQQIKDLNLKKIKEFAELDAKYTYEKQKTIDSIQFVKEKELNQIRIRNLETKSKVREQWMWFGVVGLLLSFALIHLIRSRNFTRREKQNQELFSQELIKTQEDQRTQVARDLHDSVGQKLMLLTKKVKSFKNEDIDDLAKGTLEELRGISRGLYPATFGSIGITASIELMINEVDANTDLFFMMEIDNIDESLSNQNGLHLYRIIQEVLNNIVKHADAKSVSISIAKKNDFIETEIKDNGIGFEFNEKLDSNSSLGMKTLSERAKIIKSKLFVNSKKNKGTTMQLITPIS